MRVAVVFPGQGSQAVGMLSAFAGNAAVDRVLDRANIALGEDVRALIDQGPAEKLNLTINTQPCMLAAAFATYDAYRAAGGRAPEMMAGHSLGEYTALTAASSLTLEDALPLVRFRAQAMQDAVPVGIGAMAAILGLADEKVRAACQQAAQGEVVEAVNFNAPSQVVIAGHARAVERACTEAKALGAKRAVLLAVSAPFHASLLRPASNKLRERLARVTLATPQVPIVNNIDVAIEKEPDRIRDALARQASGPVRWVETITRLAQDGITHVVECGPGRALSGMTARIAPSLVNLNINDPASL